MSQVEGRWFFHDLKHLVTVMNRRQTGVIFANRFVMRRFVSNRGVEGGIVSILVSCRNFLCHDVTGSIFFPVRAVLCPKCFVVKIKAVVVSKTLIYRGYRGGAGCIIIR